jgi:hypothetical protein
MLVSVTFNVAKRDDWMLRVVSEDCVGEEGAVSLRLSFTMFQRKAVWMLSYECSGDINEQHVEAGCSSEVVVFAACTLTTSSLFLFQARLK